MNPHRTRVKICGITRTQDALLAAQLGVDALGFVFYAKSPRAVQIAEARRIIQALPAFISTVGLFVNETAETVRAVMQHVAIDVLQFHGEETPAYCAQFNRPYIKAIRMQPEINLEMLAQRYETASALLLDTYVPGVQGGTGETFDWQQVPTNLSKPIIIAGGLTPDNVQTAIAHTQPYGVDVSGGVEIRKGIKDPEKLIAFMRGVMQWQ